MTNFAFMQLRRTAAVGAVITVVLGIGAQAGARGGRDDSTAVLDHGSPFHGKVTSKFIQCQRARTVTIYNSDDSYITRGTTDPKGKFKIPYGANTGYYYAKVDAFVTARGVHCRADRSKSIYFR